jgi:copper resistance protein C
MASMKKTLLSVAVLGLALLWGGSAFAHAIVKESRPVAKSTVQGPDVPVMIRFNSRIDIARSQLLLLRGEGQPEEAVSVDRDASLNILTTTLHGLAPASYKLRWQVLAADGHITRGDIPFTVTGGAAQ